jgi:heme oxygenase
VAPNSSWLYRLGQQTVAQHATADAHRLALMNVTSSSQYRGLLERIYGFEAAVETQASAIGLSAAVAGARLRVGRLHRDLLALGRNDLEIAMLPTATVVLHGAAEALGWLFVIERHVLLAGLIRRYLTGELHLGLSTARAYLDTHLDGGRRFRDFSDVVTDAVARGDVRPDALLAAARAAFDAQRQWYGRSAPRRRQSTAPAEPARPQSGANHPSHPRNAA